jgi:hypothetical protein
MTTFPRLAASALLVGLVASCAPSDGGGAGAEVPAGAKPAAVQQKALSVEELSAKVGCKPKIQVDAEDMRTGYCKTKVGQFFVNTFTTQAGKDAWMDQAPEYNPHLVGYLWTVLSDRKVLEELKAPLNGDLHLKDHRTNQMQTVQQ